MEINGLVLPRDAEPALTKWTTTQPGESEPALVANEFQGAWLVNQHAVGSSIIALSSSAVLLGGGGVTTRWNIDDVQALPDVPGVVRITARTGEMRQVAFGDPLTAQMFGATVAAIRTARERGRPFTALPFANLTTTPELHGHRITGTLGIVTDVAPMAALNAPDGAALDAGTWSLRLKAQSLGANAVVGLSVQVLPARTGLTGTDAGGLVLSGTAVLVEPLG